MLSEKLWTFVFDYSNKIYMMDEIGIFFMLFFFFFDFCTNVSLFFTNASFLFYRFLHFRIWIGWIGRNFFYFIPLFRFVLFYFIFDSFTKLYFVGFFIAQSRSLPQQIFTE